MTAVSTQTACYGSVSPTPFPSATLLISLGNATQNPAQPGQTLHRVLGFHALPKALAAIILGAGGEIAIPEAV
jgi:phytoene dehydrogenase-like protein